MPAASHTARRIHADGCPSPAGPIFLQVENVYDGGALLWRLILYYSIFVHFGSNCNVNRTICNSYLFEIVFNKFLAVWSILWAIYNF